jgi:hypothetical protein
VERCRIDDELKINFSLQLSFSSTYDTNTTELILGVADWKHGDRGQYNPSESNDPPLEFSLAAMEAGYNECGPVRRNPYKGKCDIRQVVNYPYIVGI